jgi:hypothetical protein
MPESNAVIWAVAVALIVGMLATIGYLIDKGFYGLKADLKAEMAKLWEKLDSHQSLANTNAANMLEHKGADAERQLACAERHKRLDLQLAHLQRRRTGESNEGSE